MDGSFLRLRAFRLLREHPIRRLSEDVPAPPPAGGTAESVPYNCAQFRQTLFKIIDYI
jgi:hypothetical protein